MGVGALGCGPVLAPSGETARVSQRPAPPKQTPTTMPSVAPPAPTSSADAAKISEEVDAGTTDPTTSGSAGRAWTATTQLAPKVPIAFAIEAQRINAESWGGTTLEQVARVEVRVAGRVQRLVPRPLFDGYTPFAALSLKPKEVDAGADSWGDIIVEDMNFDGYRDVRIASLHTAKGPVFQYWLYDPTSGTLVDTVEMDRLFITEAFDAKRKVIRDWRQSAPGGVEARTLRWVGSRLQTIRLRCHPAIRRRNRIPQGARPQEGPMGDGSREGAPDDASVLQGNLQGRRLRAAGPDGPLRPLTPA